VKKKLFEKNILEINEKKIIRAPKKDSFYCKEKQQWQWQWQFDIRWLIR